jgi:HAD superfamily hydrolase (TIGR01490 family)
LAGSWFCRRRRRATSNRHADDVRRTHPAGRVGEQRTEHRTEERTERAGRMVFFDLDRTLVPGSSLVCLGRELLDRGQLRRRTLATGLIRNASFRRKGAGDASVSSLRSQLLGLAAGRSYEDMADAAVAAAIRVADRVYPDARRLVEQHRKAGDVVVVVSASPQELVAGVAAAIGAQLGIGTRAEVIGGRFTGRVDGTFCYRDGKLVRIAEELGRGALVDSLAYADSASDLPLLFACSRAVAVNPDRGLLAVARQSGWPVLRLS